MRRVRIAFKRTVMETLAALRGKLSPVPAGKYLLGLSGGADSVALLLLLLLAAVAPIHLPTVLIGWLVLTSAGLLAGS